MNLNWKEVFVQVAVSVMVSFFAVVWSNQEISRINSEKVLEGRDDIEQLRQRMSVLEGLHLK